MTTGRTFARLGVAALTLAALACGGDDPTAPGDAPALTLSQQGGDKQSGPAGSILAEPLRVVVHNPLTDLPVPNVRVRFTPATGAEVSETVQVTDRDGVAEVEARVGPNVGAAQLVAVAAIVQPGRDPTDDQIVEFRADVTPPPQLLSISSTTVSPGDTVLLTGLHFNQSLSGNEVFFGESEARILGSPGPNQLRVLVPACVPPGPVPVVVVLGSARTEPLQVTYRTGAALLNLAPFTGAVVTATELGSLGNCLTVAGDGATYLLVPQFATDQVPLDTTAFALAATGGTVAARDWAAASRDLPAALLRDPQVLQERLDAALRGAESRLAVDPRLRARAQGRDATPLQSHLPAPALGSKRTFRVLSSIDPGSPVFRTVTAQLRYAGDHILIYYDDAAPGGQATLPETQLQAVGRLFDNQLYPLVVRTFGVESDIDDNGRTIVLMTAVVNQMVTRERCQKEGFIAGFFFGYDLASTSPNSNQAEIFYTVVPDPQGTLSCPHPVFDVLRLIPGTFIHELQHMVSFYQHVLLRGGDPEALWLNEALSAIAEEKAARLFEERYPPAPGQQFPDSALGFITGVVRNAYLYLRDHELNSITRPTHGATLRERGGGWLFLRWLGDQKGDDIYRQLVQTNRTGVTNVEFHAGESFASLFGDFGIALYTDSIPGVAESQVPPRYRFLSRNLRRVFQILSSSGQTVPYPLELEPLPPGQLLTDRMVIGTSDFFVLPTAPASGAVALRFTRPDGETFFPPRNAQLGIFRLPGIDRP